MKICILSMQRVCNYGSVLQSYSLKKILEELGHDVEFIDIDKNPSNTIYSGLNLRFRTDRDYDQSAGRIAKLLTRADKYLLIRIINRIKQNRQNMIFKQFQQNILKLNNNTFNEYDVCIIGSDEVFNCMQGDGIGLQLFGDVPQARRVITYAACCGFTKLADLPDDAKASIAKTLKNIEDFSVRDENTKIFVQTLVSNSNIEFNLDPVLIGDFDNEMSLENQTRLPKRYCLIYAYANRISSKQDIEQITRFCKKHKLEIITIGVQQKWISKHYLMGPFELLNAVQNAEFVITDTFHGCIFSYKYAEKFGVIVRESNANKLLDLVHRIRVDDHLLDTISEDKLESIYNISKDSNSIKQYLKSERKKSIQYLINSIK